MCGIIKHVLNAYGAPFEKGAGLNLKTHKVATKSRTTVSQFVVQVVRNLTLKTHTNFYLECLATMGGVPAHTSVDGAKAWNGVEFILKHLYGDTRKATPLCVDGQVSLLCFLILFLLLY